MAGKTEPSSSQPPNLIAKIKKEAPDYEIKEYAESAMKEMLGWYGYAGGVNGGVTSGPGSDTSSDLDGGRSCSSGGAPTALNIREGSLPPSPPPPNGLQNVPPGCMCCAWCQKVGNASQFNFKTPNGNKVFCSEMCFTQCRRASFKRNKTCDWCRHVRHTVNYVDFQDGDHQLQFCSDKCLNQYKMNIFCKETQAHLELHPHLQEPKAPNNNEISGNNLITPELWMRDCRSQSPETDRSTTPPRIPSPLVEIKMSPSRSPHDRSGISPPQRQVKKPTPTKDHLNKKKIVRSKRISKTPNNRCSDHCASSSSPRSTESISPPKPVPFQPPLTHVHPLPPPPYPFPDQHRPIFIPPGFMPPAQMFPDMGMRFPLHRPVSRKLPPNGHTNIPPLLPITRPLTPHPMLAFPPQQNLVPPPITFVPYPIVIPFPLPIPIPIPLPGLKLNMGPNGVKTVSTSPTLSLDTTKPPSPPEDLTTEKVQEEPENLKLHRPACPPRKRKRLPEISPDTEPIRKPKTVQA